MKTTTPTNINPKACFTEEKAREYARSFAGDLSIIHSPHRDNKYGDFFVGPPEMGMIRNWEKVVYEGKGTKA